MLDPDPKKRGTAKEHAKAMKEIIHDFEERAQKKLMPSLSASAEGDEEGDEEDEDSFSSSLNSSSSEEE
jgi:hypothetical protein